MRRGRRNPGVGSGRRQASWGEFRIVVSMDEVVGDSRVLRVSAIERLQQIGRLFLLPMRPVRGRYVRQECERVKHLRFDIFAVAGGQVAHRELVVQRARAVRNGGSVLIDQAERMDELALALGARLDPLRQLNFPLASRNRSGGEGGSQSW